MTTTETIQEVTSEQAAAWARNRSTEDLQAFAALGSPEAAAELVRRGRRARAGWAVDIDGYRIGKVAVKSVNTSGEPSYMATRVVGEHGVDARRVGYGFRSVESATAWIARVAH